MTCCTWVCCRSYSSRTLSCLQMIGSCQHTLSPLLLVMRDPSPPLGEESRILAKINNDELNIHNLIYCNCTLHYIRSIPLHRMTPSLEINISMICVYLEDRIANKISLFLKIRLQGFVGETFLRRRNSEYSRKMAKSRLK